MKTNKKLAKQLSVMFFALLMPLQASAEDFKVNGIYYNITSSADQTHTIFTGMSTPAPSPSPPPSPTGA